jgi:hypothetical protein
MPKVSSYKVFIERMRSSMEAKYFLYELTFGIFVFPSLTVNLQTLQLDYHRTSSLVAFLFYLEPAFCARGVYELN